MASRFDRRRVGLKTTVAINSPSLKKTNATGTSARKFIASDATRDAIERAQPPGKSNDEHVVSKSVALNTLGVLAQRAADLANVALADTRASIEQLEAADLGDSRASLPFSADKDIENFEGRKSQSIVDSILDLSAGERLRIGGVATRLVREKLQGLIPKREQGAAQKAVLPAPELAHVTVDLDKNRGATDCFFSRIVFTLPLDKIVSVSGKRSALRGVRLFRAEFPLRGGRKPNILSIHGIEKIRSNKLHSRVKNSDLMSIFENKLRDNGLSNAINSLSPIDSNLNVRIASEESIANPFAQVKSSANIGIQGDPRQGDSVASLLGSGTGLDLDKSVIENLQSMRNLQVRERIAPDIFGEALEVGRQAFTDGRGIGVEQARQIQKGFERSTTIVVDDNNSSGFKEIAFITPGLPGDDSNSYSKIIGDDLQITFDDDSITYGRTYQYYLVAVSSDMKESVRSRVVEVVVDGLRVPERPKDVIAHVERGTVTLSISVDDQLVEKFEIYRRDVDVQTPSSFSLMSRVISDAKGFVSNLSSKQKQSNGFVNVGETLNVAHRGGSVFRDPNVKQGRRYLYRVYSVDIFGNKSESPVESLVFVSDPDRKSDLSAPTVLAEVDSSTNKIKVTFFSNDDRITGFFLSRRDVGIKQSAFTAPGEVNALKFGNPRHSYGSKNFEDVVLRGREHLWNGYYPRLGKSHQVFIDQTVQFDRTYQYQIVGTDKFGNKTMPGFSKRLMVTRRPLVAAAVGLSAELVVSNGSVMGVKLHWEDGNIDVSAEDRIGDREVLENTSVRTLYQVERQKLGESIWKEFPMVEGTEFFDVVKEFSPSESGQSFRPEYLDKGTRYAYRIQAFQTGAFISNVTEPVEIVVDSPPARPVGFQLTNPDTKLRPFYVMLNWNTDPTSGVVDHWDIERAVVNNLAADRLNFKNPSENASLKYKPFRTIFRESSRFNSQTSDADKKDVDDPYGIILGEHHFMDSNVEFGQSYFYKIRAVSVDGTQSSWVNKGIKISDPAFEKKQDAVVVRDEKKRLSSSNVASRFKSNILRPTIDVKDTSFSLLPSFAKDELPKNLNVALAPVLQQPLSLSLDLKTDIVVNEAVDLIPTISSPIVAAQIQSALQKVIDTTVVSTQLSVAPLPVLNTTLPNLQIPTTTTSTSTSLLSKVVNLSKTILSVPIQPITTVYRK